MAVTFGGRAGDSWLKEKVETPTVLGSSKKTNPALCLITTETGGSQLYEERCTIPSCPSPSTHLRRSSVVAGAKRERLLRMSWCTIESDPAVFTELMHEIGVRGVQMREMYTLDEIPDEKVYGLVFLFKYCPDTKDDRPTEQDCQNVFFASQMIPNACATQAIISVLLNSPDVDIGDELTAFKAFTKEFPPDLRGLAITNSEAMRKAHNSFARPEPFVSVEQRATSDDDVYHFISYVPIDGKLYELDGLKAGPIYLGDIQGDNWLDVARPSIQQRIETYSTKEIRFNLMAITADRRERLLIERDMVEKERNMTIGKVQSRSGQLPLQAELDRIARSTDEPAPIGEVAVDERTVDEMIIALAHLTARSARLQADLLVEEQRAEQGRIENIRRRHNYVPFIVNFLKILAQRGDLMPLVEEARKKRHKLRE